MECNKDEAVRARQLAEKKMENNDFEGARKVALKARNLYPELENITQLLSICDVHCSAQKLVLGSEKDWYGILQVEKLADESTVKKQYRKLALFLHPDKNRFPGAESAFKLICEANAVLSDTTKKSLYDSKTRMSVRYAAVNPTPRHMNGNSVFNKQYFPPNNVNGFSSLNQRQAPLSSSSVRQDVFCTSCPFCSMKHMFPRKMMNTTQRCHKCRKEFMGIEITAQGVPLGPNWTPQSTQQVPGKPGASQSAGFQAKGIPTQGNFTTGLQNDKGSSASNMGSHWSASTKTVRCVRTESVYTGVQVGNATKLNEDLKAKQTEKHNGNSWSGANKDGTCNVKRRETGDQKNKRRKKGRKFVVESSESCDTSSDSDLEDVTIKMDCNSATDLNSGHAHYPRRSSRKRSNVTYNEGGGGDDDDDLPKSPKRSGGSPEDKENGQNDASDVMYPKRECVKSSHTYADYSEPEIEIEEMESIHSEEGFGEKDGDHDASTEEPVECDDPEFYDFDKDRDENCFAANQFWACYDEVDGMPRFYAKVKQVHSAPFEASFTWLEAKSISEAQKKWISEELPVGCGSFKLGKTCKTSARMTFSHQVHCEKSKNRGFIIYPQKGEVWGIYKDWDLSWSSNPENHREHKYEIVEVLSDFVEDTGIKVCYLDKIGGFVSLFQRSEINSFLIWPGELYRFSHHIPSFKMTGSEREGVPMGSFELDPAALPLKPEDLYYPGKAKMGTENGGQLKSATEKGNFVKSENSTPKEFVDLSGDD